MKRPLKISPLKIIKTHEQPQYLKMLSHDVCYVHGSHSGSFAGLVRFRALLSMEEIDGTGWFAHHSLTSGERGYSVQNIYKNQPISKGVSMNDLQNYLESAGNYSSMGLTGQNFPVLYGLNQAVAVHPTFIDHPVSQGGINIDFIAAIYVPEVNVIDAKNQLTNIPRLQKLVYPLL